MKSNIFVDIASEEQFGDRMYDSVCEVFRKQLNKNGENLNTKPCFIEVSDDWLKVYSSFATFTFDVVDANISYNIWKNERDCVDIVKKCFDCDIKYVADNLITNSADVIIKLRVMFEMLLEAGADGFSVAVQNISNEKFDYDKNKKGEWNFWVKKSNGDWTLSSFRMFTNFLCDTFIPNTIEDRTYYSLMKVAGNHYGYLAMRYVGITYLVS